MSITDKKSVIEKLKPINKITVPQMSDPVGLHIYTVQLNSYEEAKNTFHFKPHKHSFFEVYFVISGSVIYNISNQKGNVQANEGEFILVHPNVKHTLLECSSDFTRLSFCFELDDVEKNAITSYINNSLFNLKYPCKKTNDEIDTAICTIAQHVSTKNFFTPYIIRNDIFNLICELSKLLSPHQELVSDLQKEDTLADSRYVYAKKFIKDNIRSNIKTVEVATNVHLSTKQLNRLFFKYEGKSVFDYIQEKRCSAAKKLLLDKNRSLSEISEILGFSDEFYFNRFFRKNTGFTPHKFRLLNGEK